MTFPQPVFSPVVAEAGLTLAFEASAAETGDTITGPSEIQAGDLLVLFDLAQGFSVPTTAVPSGFSIAQNTDDGANTRAILSYKIADGSEADSSLTGMSDLSHSKVLIVFRPSSALSSASHASGGAEITDGDPSSQSVQASNGTPPVVVIGAYGSPNTLDPRTFSPAKDGEVENTATSSDRYLAWRIDNSSPQDTTIDMEDEGDNNVLMSTYIEVS